MNDHDDARDLHAALGGLLVDEPTAPWSAQDDVARGRARQRRRRTTALGGIGLMAALALVVGVLGPWSPTANTAPPASPSAELEQEVTDALAELGWQTVGIARPRTEATSPEVIRWDVSRTDGTAERTARLVLRVWDAGSWASGPTPSGGVLEECGVNAVCGLTSTVQPSCGEGPCWSRTSTSLLEEYEGLPVGTAIDESTSAAPRAAAEIVTTPATCTGTCRAVLETSPFLSDYERIRVLGAIQGVLETLPEPAPVPASQPCTSEDVVLAVGTDSIDPPDGRAMVLVSVRARDSSVECVLDGFPQVVALGVDGAALPFVQEDEGLDQQVRVAQGAGGIFRVSPRLCAPVGGDVATLRVTLPGGGPAVDVDARVALPLVSCAVGAGAGTDLWVSGFEPSSIDVPSTITACSPGEVKLIPATGAPVAVTGARGGWIEIHARNPEVDCLATAPASVSFVDADGTALTFRYRQGVYQSADLDSSAIEVSQAIGPSRFALTKYRCDGAVQATAATAYVTLEGWDSPVAVQLPPGFGIERCAGAVDDPGNTVFVSNLTSGP